MADLLNVIINATTISALYALVAIGFTLIFGVGGVFTAEDAYRKIRAGATLVQLYTGLIYRGPAIARDINRGLLDLLDRDGFDSVEDAVGADLS